MKRTIITAMLAASFFFGTSGASHAQQTTKVHKKHTVRMRTDRVGPAISNVGAEVTGDTQSAGDPLYLNHPYFNGEARWSHEDSLYKHGDFPWALVNKAGSGYSFNPESGRWEQNGTMGTMAPTR